MPTSLKRIRPPRTETPRMRDNRSFSKVGTIREEPGGGLRTSFFTSSQISRNIVAFGIGKEWCESTKITDSDVQRLAMLYDMDPNQVKSGIVRGIAPIQAEGFEWGSAESSKLRDKYRKKAVEIIERLENTEHGWFSTAEEIFLYNTPKKEIKHSEFSSAAVMCDRRPYRRTGEKSEVSAYFTDIYSGDGRRTVVFAMFDSFPSKRDYEFSAIAGSKFRKFVKENRVSTRNAGTALSEFYRELEKTMARFREFEGMSCCMGVVDNGRMVVLSSGEIRTYGIKMFPETNASVLCPDDSFALGGAGKKIPASQWDKITQPFHHLGESIQEIKGVRASQDSKLPERKIVEIDLTGVDAVLVLNKGCWGNLRVLSSGGYVRDPMQEVEITELIKNSGKLSAERILKSVCSEAEKNRRKGRKEGKTYFISPYKKGIGAIAFFV